MNSSFKKSVVAGTLALTALTGIPIHSYAQSTSELQAQINQLLATISQLQAQLGGNTSYANYTWTRSLTVGSTGEDVRMLQRFLNSDPATQVALVGAGSPGNETTYFGPATKAAVIKFQNKYRADVLLPVGLISGTGYFGPSSIAKANVLAKGTVVTPTPTPDKPDLSGEGTLDTFEIDEADDTDVKEAGADVPIATLTLEAKDGDIEISRLDLSLVADSGNTEKDPWDVFENVSLWVDGEKIAEVSADSKSDYLNRNLGTLRFSDLDLVLEEDDEVEITVAASVRNNIDGAGSNATWSVAAERMRYFDADHVATDESSTGDLGTGVSFDIVERGFGEELKFSLSSDNPDRTDIVVDDSTRTNNVTILEYTIEAIDADIELDTLYINLETGTAPVSDVVGDVKLVIGGKTFKDDGITTTGSYSATNTLVAFDIDGDITIDDGDKEKVKVVVDLKPRTAYQNGETIIARVTSAERDMTEAEGSDDITDLSGTVIGKEHSLLSEGIVSSVDSVSFETDTQGENDTTGIFTAEFEVTAVEGDYYITENAGTTTSTSTGGIRFTVEGANNTPTSVSGILSSSADEDTSGVFTVREGQTETFTLTVVVDASTAGQYRITMNDIIFSDDTDGITDGTTYSFTPSNNFRSPYLFINN